MKEADALRERLELIQNKPTEDSRKRRRRKEKERAKDEA
jgi:hypothetical protein